MDHRSYYAIIPANVRYDDSLIPSAKLLYGEITALCNEKGYCWASNEYFANQYKVSKPTIQNWLKSLEEKGYIYREVKYKEGSKEIEARYIRILGGGHQENLVGGHQEIYQDNNTSINNTFNNTKEYIRDLPPSKKSKAKPIRHKYGEYKNVLLSDEQMEKLKIEFPNDYPERIERLSEYCEHGLGLYVFQGEDIPTPPRIDTKKLNMLETILEAFNEQMGKDMTKTLIEYVNEQTDKLGLLADNVETIEQLSYEQCALMERAIAAKRKELDKK